MKNRTKQTGRRGFSLLELLAVMSIMAMLTTLAVTSYFSAIRGMTRRSSVKHLANTLILARQRACMEGTRVSVMVFNEVSGYDEQTKKEKIAPSYVVCKEVGRISFISQGTLIDEFASLDTMFGTAAIDANYLGSIRLYNLKNGGWSNVYPSVKKVEPEISSAYELALKGQEVLHKIPMFGFVINKKVPNPSPKKDSWNVGDSYGIEVVPINSLPRGFQFTALPRYDSAPICVTFRPDGSATPNVISILATQAPGGKSGVTVKEDGSITYDEKWN
jgi:prepilin-type N-terminal cleavage/methylation domain-containing protein